MKEYKLTKEMLENQIANVDYQVLIPNKLVHCTITVINGYRFTGEASVIDPSRFDLNIGKQVAYENAFDKMWPVYGYLVQDQMYNANLPVKERVQNELYNLTENVNKLKLFVETDKFKSIPDLQREQLTLQLSVMTSYQNILTDRIKTL